jgi:hypothetical protein
MPKFQLVHKNFFDTFVSSRIFEQTIVKISGPSEVRHALHVSNDYTWSGEDPSEIFNLEKKVGEG